jgi:hypothetical protein
MAYYRPSIESPTVVNYVKACALPFQRFFTSIIDLLYRPV